MADLTSLISDYDPVIDTRPLSPSRQSLGLLSPAHPLLPSLSFHFVYTMAKRGHRPVMICRKDITEKELPVRLHAMVTGAAADDDHAGQADEEDRNDFDHEVVDVIDMKYLDNLDEVAWFLRNIHGKTESQMPTCLVIHALDSFGCPGSDQLLTMGRVLSDLDDARRYISRRLGQACPVMVSAAITEGPFARIMKHSLGRVLKLVVNPGGEADDEGLLVLKEVMGGQGSTVFRYKSMHHH